MNYQRVECKECGCVLWSGRAKEIKTCPDCEYPDSDIYIYSDLETQLNEVL